MFPFQLPPLPACVLPLIGRVQIVPYLRTTSGGTQKCSLLFVLTSALIALLHTYLCFPRGQWAHLWIFNFVRTKLNEAEDMHAWKPDHMVYLKPVNRGELLKVLDVC